MQNEVKGVVDRIREKTPLLTRTRPSYRVHRASLVNFRDQEQEREKQRGLEGGGASYLLVRMRGSARVRATTAVCVCISARTRARLHIDEPTLSLSLSLELRISGWVHARSPIVHSRRYTVGRPRNYDSINSAVILTRYL